MVCAPRLSFDGIDGLGALGGVMRILNLIRCVFFRSGAFNLGIYHAGAPGSAGGYGARRDQPPPRNKPHLDSWQARGKKKHHR